MINQILLNIFSLRFALVFLYAFWGFPGFSLYFFSLLRRRIINLIAAFFLLYLKRYENAGVKVYGYDSLYSFQVMPFPCRFYYRVFVFFLLNGERIRRVIPELLIFRVELELWHSFCSWHDPQRNFARISREASSRRYCFIESVVNRLFVREA